MGSKSVVTDNRSVADGKSIALGGSSGNTIQVTDGELMAISADYLKSADQSNTDRLQMMLSTVGGMIQGGQDQTKTLLEAKQAAENPGSLGISQVTILIVAGAAVLLFIGMKK